MDYYRIANTTIVHELLGTELIIANLNSGDYHSVRESGIVIWQLLISGYSLEQTIAQLSQKYSTTSINIIKIQVANFVAKLVDKEILVMSNTAVNSMESSVLAWSAEFKFPVFASYNDMQELLLLDPIHEVDEQGWPNAK